MSKELVLAAVVSLIIHLAIYQVGRTGESRAPKEAKPPTPLKVILIDAAPHTTPVPIENKPIRPLEHQEAVSAVPPRPLPASIKKLLSGRIPRKIIRKDTVEKKKEQRPLHPKKVDRMIPEVYPAREVFRPPTAQEAPSSPPAVTGKVKEDEKKESPFVQSRLPDLFEQPRVPDDTGALPAASNRNDQEKIEVRKTPIGPMIKARPKPKFTPRPSYPRSARRKGIEGSTLLRVEVLASGRVGRITLLHSAGHPSLDRSAKMAVKKWRFEPAMEGDRPIASWIRIPIRFKLH